MRSGKREEKQGISGKEQKIGGRIAKLSVCLAVVFAVGIMTVKEGTCSMTPVVYAQQSETSQEIPSETETLTKEQADQIVGFIIEKISSGSLTDEAAAREAIAEGEEKFQVTLTEEDKENIIKIVNTVNSWDFDAEELAAKAKDLYDKYGTDLLQNPEQAMKEAAEDSVKGFFKGVGELCVNVGKGIANFFKEGAEKLFHLF